MDSSGDLYVTGGTASATFPTTANAFQKSFVGLDEAYVAKLNPAGTSLLYSTFLTANSSNANSTAVGIAVNASGDAYVTGYTISSGFPITAGAYQTKFAGSTSDVFVTELNTTMRKAA